MEKKKILCYHTSVKITLMRDPIVPNRKGKNSMEQFFKLKEHGTDVKTELAAGLTTFMTMAYRHGRRCDLYSDGTGFCNCLFPDGISCKPSVRALRRYGS